MHTKNDILHDQQQNNWVVKSCSHSLLGFCGQRSKNEGSLVEGPGQRGLGRFHLEKKHHSKFGRVKGCNMLQHNQNYPEHG